MEYSMFLYGHRNKFLELCLKKEGFRTRCLGCTCNREKVTSLMRTTTKVGLGPSSMILDPSGLTQLQWKTNVRSTYLFPVQRNPDTTRTRICRFKALHISQVISPFPETFGVNSHLQCEQSPSVWTFIPHHWLEHWTTHCIFSSAGKVHLRLDISKSLQTKVSQSQPERFQCVILSIMIPVSSSHFWKQSSLVNFRAQMLRTSHFLFGVQFHCTATVPL